MTAQSNLININNNSSFSSSEPSFIGEGGAAEAEAAPAAPAPAENNEKAKSEPEAAVEEKPVKEVKERVFYADWIRAMAIILVIFVHCLVNSFDASGLDPDDVP